MGKADSIHDSRAKRDQILSELLETVATSTKVLEGLAEKQRAAIVGLIAVTKTISAYQRSANRPSQEPSKQFDTLVERIAPAAAKGIGLSGLWRGCLDESIAYAGAMSRCRKEGKTDDECDRANASEAAAEVICMTKQLEALIPHLREILRGPLPGPGPRPV